jgi:hypothetical protein
MKKLLFNITFILLFFSAILSYGQNSIYQGGANQGDGITTCSARTVTIYLGFWGSNVGENAYVTFQIDKRRTDLNTIKPFLKFSDGISNSGDGDASSLFETPTITDNYLGNPNLALYTITLKNNIDLSAATPGGFYLVGYSEQLTASGDFGDFSYDFVVADNGGSDGPTNFPFTSGSTVMGNVYPGTCVNITPDSNQTPQGVAVSGNLLNNDETKSGTLTVSSATFNGNPVSIGSPTIVPGVGTLTLNSNGSYTFIPDPAYTGNVDITYTAGNGTESGTSDLDINVIPLIVTGTNTPPVSNDDNAITYANVTLTSNVLNNDFDPNGNTIVVSGVTGGAVGAAFTVQGQQPIFDFQGNIESYATVPAGQMTLNSNGTYSFVPAPGFFGTVNPITYTISDGNGGTDTAILSITVKDNEKEVFANDDTSVKPQGVNQSGNVLLNDFNPNATTNPFNVTNASFSVNGGSPQAIAIGAPTVIPNVGTLTLNANGTYTFNPLPTFVGSLNVPYTVCNSASTPVCDTATLNLSTTGINIQADDDDFSSTPINGTTGGSLAVSVFGNDNYGGGADNTVNDTNSTITQIGTWPTGITINEEGIITVAPGTTAGTYHLTYQICDAINTVPQNCDQGIVTLVVAGDVLITNADNGSGSSGTNFQAVNVILNDTLNGVTPVVGTQTGQVTLSQSGSWPTGFSLNTATGMVNVSSAVTPGVYNMDYQICVNGASPAICKIETVTVVVSNSCAPSCNLNGISMFVWLGDGDSQFIGDATNDDEDDDDFIGFRNYGTTAVDISGWELYVDQKGTSSPVFIFPNGTIIQPGQAFVVISDWNGPNPLPFNWFDANFVSGEGMFEETSNNQAWAILRNTSNQYITIHQQGNSSQGQSLPSGTKLCNTNVTNLVPGDFDGCEMVYFNENTCSYAERTDCNIPILNPTIVADNDSFTSTIIYNLSGGTTLSVLLNDNFDGGPDGSANSSNSILSTVGTWTGFTLNTTTGVITVATGTAPGTYNLTYRLCAQVNSTICDTAVVTIVVSESLDLEPDFATTSAGNSLTFGSILSNDKLEGIEPIIGSNPGQVTISQSGTWNPGISLDTTTGMVTAASTLLEGIYVVTYQVCVNGATPTYCRTETITIEITAAAFCFKPGNFASNGLPTNVGISSLRIDNNSNWPMVREGGWIALESHTKGFVPNRLSNLQIQAIPVGNLVIGMMVYNIDEDCLQINVDGKPTGWKCFKTPACPDL